MLQDFTANWNYPTRIWFGLNRLQSLPAACNEFEISNPLIITDSTLAKLPMLEKAMTIMRNNNIKTSLFTDIKPNPIAENIFSGVEAIKSGNHDGIIAIGGGSVLDSAKIIALTVRQDRPLWDYEEKDDNYKRINANNILPLIAVPTTSGTGSEVGRVALIIDEEKHQKRFIFHPDMVPKLVIADPTLTVALPPFLTAATGMDALAHNLEAYCSPGYHPMADGIALEGLRLIKENLVLAYQDGNNLNARANLMAASIMGGTAFQKGLGAVHSLSHPVGAIYDHHHGLLNAIFMPYVLRFNQAEIEAKMQTLARYLNLENPSTETIITWLISLCEQMAIPTCLSALNVDEEHIETIVQQALTDPSTSGNPRALTAEDFATIFRHTVAGKL